MILRDIFWVIPKIYDLLFRVNYILQNLTSKIFFFFFFFYFMYIHNTFQKKRNKNGGQYINYLLGGPKLTPPRQILCIIQYKTSRNDIFVTFIIPLY